MQMDEDLRLTIASSPKDFIRPGKRRKVIILGSPGVGKSAIMMRFKDDIFLDYYEPTIQNSMKKNILINGDYIELELIDIDGQTEYTIFSFSKFAFGIHGYVIIYSIENRQSFELIKIINSRLVSLVGREVPKVLVGNKCDLSNRREIPYNEGKAFAKSIGCPFIECSAKLSDNVNRTFHKILVEINRYESHVDFKGINCRKFVECFVQNEKKMKMAFYVLMILNMVKQISY